MWTRARLKKEAKHTLSQFGYWKPFLVSTVLALITGLFGGAGGISTLKTGINVNVTADLSTQFSQYANELQHKIVEFFSDPLITITSILLITFILLVSICLSFAWKAFLIDPLAVGKNRYYMEHRGFDSKFDRLFYIFGSGRYISTVKTMFFYELKIFLWSLLFIIPGIIKSYEYFMVPYILAENPQISTKRAFELSRMMTKGEKWHIFVLQLSFLGWEILASLACGLGFYFLAPYIEATHAELYQVMREKAHGLNFSDYEELPGFFPD